MSDEQHDDETPPENPEAIPAELPPPRRAPWPYTNAPAGAPRFNPTHAERRRAGIVKSWCAAHDDEVKDCQLVFETQYSVDRVAIHARAAGISPPPKSRGGLFSRFSAMVEDIFLRTRTTERRSAMTPPDANQILFAECQMNDPGSSLHIDARWVAERIRASADARQAWGDLVTEALATVEVGALGRYPTAGTDPGEVAASQKPLTEKEHGLLRVLIGLPAGTGLTGKELLALLPVKGVHGLTQSALTTRLIPTLRQDGWKLPNRRPVGYYLSEADRWRFSALMGPDGGQ